MNRKKSKKKVNNSSRHRNPPPDVEDAERGAAAALIHSPQREQAPLNWAQCFHEEEKKAVANERKEPLDDDKPPLPLAMPLPSSRRFMLGPQSSLESSCDEFPSLPFDTEPSTSPMENQQSLLPDDFPPLPPARPSTLSIQASNTESRGTIPRSPRQLSNMETLPLRQRAPPNPGPYNAVSVLRPPYVRPPFSWLESQESIYTVPWKREDFEYHPFMGPSTSSYHYYSQSSNTGTWENPCHLPQIHLRPSTSSSPQNPQPSTAESSQPPTETSTSSIRPQSSNTEPEGTASQLSSEPSTGTSEGVISQLPPLYLGPSTSSMQYPACDIESQRQNLSNSSGSSVEYPQISSDESDSDSGPRRPLTPEVKIEYPFALKPSPSSVSFPFVDWGPPMIKRMSIDRETERLLARSNSIASVLYRFAQMLLPALPDYFPTVQLFDFGQALESRQRGRDTRICCYGLITGAVIALTVQYGSRFVLAVYEWMLHLFRYFL